MEEKHVIIALVVAILFNFGLIAYKLERKYSAQAPALPQFSSDLPPNFGVSPLPAPPAIKEPEAIEPVWSSFPAVRKVTNLGEVLSDIESHMPAGHIYRDSDKVTWAHETTHGINSNIRQRFQGGQTAGWNGKRYLHVANAARINGFYCLKDRAAVIVEPPGNISQVASKVPNSLRGDVYNLYLVSQASSWNDSPLYIFDEWSAYTNGSAERKELGMSERGETVQYMLEFDVYALTLASTIQNKGYDDKQFKAFLMWNIKRSMELYNNEPGATAYLNKLRTSGDAESLRAFTRNYCGASWTKAVLGF